MGSHAMTSICSVKAENDQMKSTSAISSCIQLAITQCSQIHGKFHPSCVVITTDYLATCSDDMKPSKHLWTSDKPQKQALKQALKQVAVKAA